MRRAPNPVPKRVEARTLAGDVAGRIWASSIRHLCEHRFDDRKILLAYPTVTLNIAEGDGPRHRSILSHIKIAEHLPRARGRVAPLDERDARKSAAERGDGRRGSLRMRLRRARGFILWIQRRVMEAPRAIVRGKGVLPVEGGVAVSAMVLLWAVS